MEKYSFIPGGVCSAKIEFESDGKIIKNICFTRGCNGNTKGIAALADGMEATEIVRRLKGTDCNGRGTSCPDQLSRAIEQLILNK